MCHDTLHPSVKKGDWDGRFPTQTPVTADVEFLLSIHLLFFTTELGQGHCGNTPREAVQTFLVPSQRVLEDPKVFPSSSSMVSICLGSYPRWRSLKKLHILIVILAVFKQKRCVGQGKDIINMWAWKGESLDRKPIAWLQGLNPWSHSFPRCPELLNAGERSTPGLLHPHDWHLFIHQSTDSNPSSLTNKLPSYLYSFTWASNSLPESKEAI